MSAIPSLRRPTARLARPAAVLALAAIAVACGTDEAIVDPGTGPGTGPNIGNPTVPTGGRLSIGQYVGFALDSMQAYSINQSINWPQFRARWLQASFRANTYRQTYVIIDSALAQLDPHSGIFPPDRLPGSSDAPVDRPDLRPNGRMITPRVGYLWVPGFIGRNQIARVDSTHDIIRTLDANRPCGWIVDVRANNGGFFFALLASVGPLYEVPGSRYAGGLRYNGTYREQWYYAGGRFGLSNGRDSVELNPTRPYTPQRQGLPVAVLHGTSQVTVGSNQYGSITASAGEAIALSFKGGPPSRSFGEATYGVASGRTFFYMPDSARIDVTDSYMFARNNFTPGDNPIAPDEVVANGRARSYTGDENDPAVQAAVAWLNQQPSCTSPTGTLAPDAAPRPARLPAPTPPSDGVRRRLPDTRTVLGMPARVDALR